MLYGGNARKHSTFHSFRSMCMRGRDHSIIFGCFYDCVHFFLCKLRAASIFGHTQYSARGSNFNKICSIFISLPHGFARIFNTVDHPFFRTGIAHQLFSISIGRIGMATG